MVSSIGPVRTPGAELLPNDRGDPARVTFQAPGRRKEILVYRTDVRPAPVVAGGEIAVAHMMVDAGDRHAAGAHGLSQHPETAKVGDIEQHDEVGAAQLTDRFAAAVRVRKIVEKELEPARRGTRVGDDHLDPLGAKQVH